ncbi:14609_t:CDS:2 [Cetraspora pellucida]|uniref:14609_t:CDS:1 n=1 Tax=Cetraspora pellucida TaxID=1433469 RepID=A0ACA9LXA8_9GLOM|nr:14609_t:CDS:2 [Cetraspora pellucida]
MYTEELEYNKETIIAKELFKLPRRSEKLKIYNPKTNRMIAINGEERLLVLPFNKMPILRKSLSFVSNKIWDIIAEKSLFTKSIGNRETQEWRNNILMNFLHHPNLTPSKYSPNVLYDAFSKADVLGPKHILAILSSYAEELANKLSDCKTKEQARKARDQAKRRFQELGLSKEQADTLIPIRASGRHVDERDPIKIIAQDIIKNNLSPEEINGIAYNLASSAPTTVVGNSHLNLL